MLGVSGPGGGNPARQVVLVDGSNLVRHEFENGVESGLEQRHERRFLLGLCGSNQRRGGTIVFFDGPARHAGLARPKDVELDFSQTEKADDRIISRLRLLRLSEPGARVSVVTYDRGLAARAKEEGGAVEFPSALLRRLGL